MRGRVRRGVLAERGRERVFRVWRRGGRRLAWWRGEGERLWSVRREGNAQRRSAVARFHSHGCTNG